MSKWTRKRKREKYYRRAKKGGYRSRSSYKLLQLDRKHHLIQGGDRVLDVGCAPGGWSQAARKRVGPEGMVVGVDLERTRPLEYDNVAFIEGDIFDEETLEAIRSISPQFEVLVSDASPKITGIWSRDHLLSVDLAHRVLEICDHLLVEGGNMVVKVFQGNELKSFEEDMKGKFSFCKRSKPDASRDRSSEIYLVGKGFSSS